VLTSATVEPAVAGVSTWDLKALALLPTASFTGSVTLDVTATATEGANGSTVSTTQQVTLNVLADTNNLYGGLGADSLTGTTADDNLWGLNGNDTISAGTGADNVLGGLGNDSLLGEVGNDNLDGGAGTDVLIGGAGTDTLSGGVGNDTLTGGATPGVTDGATTDVFRWHLGDAGTQGTGHASDVVNDFNTATATSGGDVLDLRDLLQGELKAANNGAGTLGKYLTFETSGTQTIIHISSTGLFTGTNTSTVEDQTITLSNVNLRTAFNLPSGTDTQLIQELLTRGKLITDGP
jgi:Ca2+-binding RTX toxin-like protein